MFFDFPKGEKLKQTSIPLHKDKKGLLKLTGGIITTLGEKGALISIPQGEVSVPPAKIDSLVDPTGAGDAFRAGLLKGIVMGSDLKTAAKIGAVCGAYAVEKYGTQEHYYTYDEFMARYKTNFGTL